MKTRQKRFVRYHGRPFRRRAVELVHGAACRHCRRAFTRPLDRTLPATICSHACLDALRADLAAGKARGKIHERTCARCGATFLTTVWNAAYCSRACYEAAHLEQACAHSKRRWAEAVPTERTCAECGKVFRAKDPRTIFCGFRCSSTAMRRGKMLRELAAHRAEYAAIAARELPHQAPTQWTTGVDPDDGRPVDIQVGSEHLLLWGRTATCPQCGRRFRTAVTKPTKFCSPECWHASRHRFTETTCLRCGRTFTIDAQEVDTAQFCGEACEQAFYDEVRTGTRTVRPGATWAECVNCGHAFLGVRNTSVLFCSNACAKQFHQKQRLRAYTCAECGRAFWSHQAHPKFCSVACGSRHASREHPEQVKAMHAHGAWNKGRTAADCPVIADNARRQAATMVDGIRSGRIKLYFKGRRLTAEHRRRCARGQARAIREGRRPATRHVYAGVFSDLGHYVRSGWEYNFAKILQHLGRRYVHEARTFTLSDGRTYTPDFWLPDRGTFYEVKGWFPADQQAKLAQFRAEFPEVRLHVLTAPRFKRVYRAFMHRLRLIRCFNDSLGAAPFLTPAEIDALRGRGARK